MRRSRPQTILILLLIALIQLAIAPVTGPLACSAGLSQLESCCCQPVAFPKPPCCELDGLGAPEEPAPVDPDDPCGCGIDLQPIAQCERAVRPNGDDGDDLAVPPPSVGTTLPAAPALPAPNAKRARALGRDGPPLFARFCSYLI